MNAVNYLVKPAAINSSITISGVTVLCKLPRFVSLASIGVISGSGFKGLEPQKIPKACVPAAAATCTEEAAIMRTKHLECSQR